MAQSPKPAAVARAKSSGPWWREPFMWLVVGGPLTVVVAAISTLVIAITHPDPVLTAPKATSAGDAPALEARNHAAAPKP